MDDYLKETKYCDFNHPAIQTLKKMFVSRYTDKKDLARAMFYYVRDHIHYRVGNWNRTASQTLHERTGTCSNSANLFIALCRSVGIPAGYGVMKVNGKKYFGPIALTILSKYVSEQSTHVYAYVYIDTWIKCDPSDDSLLSLNTAHINPQSQLVEWDGISDAKLNLHDSHIFSDVGPLPNIDYVFSKKMRKILSIPVRIANEYLLYLRQHGSQHESADGIEKSFVGWLKSHNKKLYYCYQGLHILA